MKVKEVGAVISRRARHGSCGNGYRWAMMSDWRRMGTVDRASTRGSVLTAAGTVGPTMARRPLPLLPGC